MTNCMYVIFWLILGFDTWQNDNWGGIEGMWAWSQYPVTKVYTCIHNTNPASTLNGEKANLYNYY